MKLVLPLHQRDPDQSWSVVPHVGGRLVGIVGKGAIASIRLEPMRGERESRSQQLVFMPARDAAAATIALQNRMLIVRPFQCVRVSCSPGPCAIMLDSNGDPS